MHRLTKRIPLLVVFAFLFTIANGQQVVDYVYYPKINHASFHLRVIAKKYFEYKVYGGPIAGNSYAFGRLEKKGNKYVLKSKLKDFDLNVYSTRSDSIINDSLFISSVIYKDSTAVYNASLIIDGDSANAINFNGEYGVMISSKFESFKIKIDDRFFTRSVRKNEIKSNRARIVIDTHFAPTDLLLLINNHYFTITSDSTIDMFDKNGVFDYTLKKEQ